MSSDAADRDAIEQLVVKLETELRRVACDLVQAIIEHERARRAALIVESLRAAFDARAIRRDDSATAAEPVAAEAARQAISVPDQPTEHASMATHGVARGASPANVVTSVGDRAWVMADDDHVHVRDEPGAVAGVVRWFDEDKGFGFIIGADGHDVFVHCKHIRGRGDRVLREGQQVVYREQEGPRGRYATHVRVL